MGHARRGLIANGTSDPRRPYSSTLRDPVAFTTSVSSFGGPISVLLSTQYTYSDIQNSILNAMTFMLRDGVQRTVRILVSLKNSISL